VLRWSLIASLVALAFAAPASAAQVSLMPGVVYDRKVEFTLHGPVIVHVLTMPRPGGLWSLQPVLSNDVIQGTERLTTIEKRLAPSQTSAGVNGDVSLPSGAPAGLVLRNGVFDHFPLPGRSSIGVGPDGQLRVERFRAIVTWQGSGQRRAVTAHNDPPRTNGDSIFTSPWGTTVPPLSGSAEAVIGPFPGVRTGVDAAAPVVQVGTGGGEGIPFGGAILAARGTAAAKLQAEAPLGRTVTIRTVTKPDWAAIPIGFGGGPLLVRGGVAVFNAAESFGPPVLTPRTARTAIGQLADGRVVLVVVDGGRRGYSVGMTNFELAQELVSLGAISAAALQSGPASAMAFDGNLLSRPSGLSESRLAEALLVGYVGVHSPPPAVDVLSPNGDAIDEEQTLSYRVVRPSTVNAALIGPDASTRPVPGGQVTAGSYTFSWNGTNPDGTPAPEGRWRFTVSAVDDLGRSSTVERAFWLDNTLGFPQGAGPTLAVPRRNPRAVATFRLIHPAAVTQRIETTSGVPLRTIARNAELEPGDVQVSWDGKTDTGATVYSGTYVARVIATNGFGVAQLTARFNVRAAAPQ
jgi:flagellar hook assembly protein FlgD